MQLLEIRAISFRNLGPEPVGFGPTTNLIVGGNGEGKTSLLEAIAVLGNLRSFRSPSLRQVAARGDSEFFLEGRVKSASGGVARLTQHVASGPPLRRTLEVNGGPVSAADYLQLLPVFALTGDDRELVAGAPQHRRAFIDRFAFLLDPAVYGVLRHYRRALQQRNAALVAGVDDREMAVWEDRLARFAAAVVDRRRRACERLADSFAPVYESLRGTAFPEIVVRYRGEAAMDAAENVSEVEEQYRKRYNETRVRDRQTGFTGDGPHRHDMDLRANGNAVRHMLSSGQTKVVAAALRLASLNEVEKQRDERFPVIVDDVDAELDPLVLARLISHLEGNRQLFLSSADGEALRGFRTGASWFEVTRGTVTGSAGERLDE